MTKTITTRTIEKRFYTPHSFGQHSLNSRIHSQPLFNNSTPKNLHQQQPLPSTASFHRRQYNNHVRGDLHSSRDVSPVASSARSSSLKGSQSHLVNTEGYAGGGASSPCYSLSPASTLTTRSGSLGKPHKVVSFKDTTETYDNYNNEEAYSSNKSLDSLPELLEPLPKGISMDKYFDNLISMITDAAEDLKV
uniref:Uncharacterized protein n=1 Tax=Lepeophtheirus salmonis TaxID=72036 RepID=A0A0K2UEH3_LEPSM